MVMPSSVISALSLCCGRFQWFLRVATRLCSTRGLAEWHRGKPSWCWGLSSCQSVVQIKKGLSLPSSDQAELTNLVAPEAMVPES